VPLGVDAASLLAPEGLSPVRRIAHTFSFALGQFACSLGVVKTGFLLQGIVDQVCQTSDRERRLTAGDVAGICLVLRSTAFVPVLAGGA
jgi:hypothetical protein